MRKAAFLLIMIIVLALGTAQADGPVNPYYQQAHSFSPVMPAAQSSLSLNVNCVQEPSLSADARWQVSVSGGRAPYQYQYFILDDDWTTLNAFADWHENAASFAYRFVAPGDYVFGVTVRDADNFMAQKTFELTVKATPGSMTIDQKVNELVRQCFAAVKSSDQYAVALWLHDWLVKNAYYDHTYTYYSADGVLLRGTGVCDSYSRAYELLLRKAGIDVQRISGGNHSWVIAKIDGEWHHIDPTWDDPGTATVPVSGQEYYRYFGLSDELMRQDHTWSASTSCHSLSANYYVRSGIVLKVLRNLVTPRDDYAYSIDSIQALLDTTTAFPLSLPVPSNDVARYESDYYDGMVGTYHYYTMPNSIFSHLAAYVLQQQTWRYHGLEARFKVAYDSRSSALIFDIDDLAVTATLDNPLGKLAVFHNGELMDYTGFAVFEGADFYFDHGLLRDDLNGVVHLNDVWYAFDHGRVMPDEMLVPFEGGVFAFKGGTLNTSLSGLTTFHGERFAFAYGQFQPTANGAWMNPLDGQWYYMANGQFTPHTGLVPYDGAIFYFVDGQLATGFSGTVKDANGAMYDVLYGQVVGVHQPTLSAEEPEDPTIEQEEPVEEPVDSPVEPEEPAEAPIEPSVEPEQPAEEPTVDSPITPEIDPDPVESF